MFFLSFKRCRFCPNQWQHAGEGQVNAASDQDIQEQPQYGQTAERPDVPAQALRHVGANACQECVGVPAIMVAPVAHAQAPSRAGSSSVLSVS